MTGVTGRDISWSGDFSIAMWVEVPQDRPGAAGTLASKFDPVARRGFTLAAISGGGGYSGPGDDLRISFGVDAGTEPKWFDCGHPSRTSKYVSNSLTVFAGDLYAATSDAEDDAGKAHVFRYLGEQDWEDLGKITPLNAHGVGPMIVHEESLYAGTWNYDWTRVDSQDLDPCRVYRFDGPERWVDCGQPGASSRLFGLASHDGKLYAVGDDFSVQVYRGGQEWEQVRLLTTYAHPMTVDGGRLVLGTLDPASVWAFDGEGWEDLGNPLGSQERSSQLHSFVDFRGSLHTGTWPLGGVAGRDAETGEWIDRGRLGDSTEVNALLMYNGKMYGGALPRAEVFRYDEGEDWTSIRRFNERPDWQPIPVAQVEAADDGDVRVREWGRVTSLTEHDGLLFASTGNSTSAFVDEGYEPLGGVYAMRAGAVATTANSISAGWHHVVASREQGVLSVFIDGARAATSRHMLVSSVETAVPLTTGAGESGAFSGRIEEVRVVGHALDDVEIKALLAARPA